MNSEQPDRDLLLSCAQGSEFCSITTTITPLNKSSHLKKAIKAIFLCPYEDENISNVVLLARLALI